ncbi:unnamed protein product [Rangifer tarandus platyrhynchus]|uniref:Uncharacterized protein n=1 Tax=Rangifer tarandus platyrhynchus TaxID=3082113 RepID=A0AC59YS66_RANTA
MGSQRVGHDSATFTFKEAIVSLLFPESWQLLFQKLLGTRARSEVSAPSIYVTVVSWDLSGGSSCPVNFASLFEQSQPPAPSAGEWPEDRSKLAKCWPGT